MSFLASVQAWACARAHVRGCGVPASVPVVREGSQASQLDFPGCRVLVFGVVAVVPCVPLQVITA